MLQPHAHIGFQHQPHPVDRIVRTRGDLAVLLEQRLHGHAADLVQDLVLVAEVHVERRRRDPDLVGDLADGGAFVAFGDENSLGRFQDFYAAKMPVALGFSRRLGRLV